MTTRLAPEETPAGAPAHVPRTGRLRWRLGVIALVVLGVGGVALRLGSSARDGTDAVSGAPAAVAAPAGWSRPPVTEDGLAERSGVRITRVAMTGAGGLVDLRFQVVDPTRAQALHDADTPPALIDEASGLVVRSLLMDHAHSGPFRQGATYYYVFNNPGNWVDRGHRVTVLLGDAQVEHVIVR
ncbi:hypothetical protein GCM10027053_20960 [Intrasporangium mesophilum]